LANQKNGHDNTSIVLTYCHVSSSLSEIRLPDARVSDPFAANLSLPEVEVPVLQDISPKRKKSNPVGLTVKLVLMLILSGVLGAGIWYSVDPTGFQQLRDRFPKSFLKP